MPVDSSIQYNGYNSYRFVQDELLASFLFGVQDMSHVTASFQAFCTSAQTAAVRAYLRFWDINNATIQTQNISFALASAIWEKKTYTASVPTGAVKAQLFFTNPISVAWYMAQPKVEEGEVATAYAQNLAGQMTYITPGGVYTGTVRAEQIIITSSESLEDRFIAINQNQILLAQGLDTVDAKTTKITAGGVYTGEISATQITVDQIVGPQIADGAVSNAKIANLAVTNAKIADLAVTNGKIANLAVDNAKIANLHGSKITAKSITVDQIDVTNLTVSKLMGTGSSTDYAQFYTPSAFSAALQFVTNDSDGLRERINIRAGRTGSSIASKNSSYLWLMNDIGGSVYMGNNQSYMQGGSNFLGVNSIGVYKEVNGIRTYL